MNHPRLFSRQVGAGFLLVAAIIVMPLTGCVAYVHEPRGRVVVEPDVFVVEDDYIYYPTYGVYYSSSRHQYAYQERGRWVGRPAPRGVSVNVLLASPSVHMDFHDSPEHHHATVVREYPRNWSPPGSRSGPGDDHRDNRPGPNRGDNRR